VKPAVIVLAAALALPSVARAQVVQVTVRVDGLACPFCAYSLEKNLKRLDGVAEIAVSVAGGAAVLTPAPGQTVDLLGIPGAVEDAGFTPRAITVDAVGRVQFESEGPLLTAADGTPLFRLDPGEVPLPLNLAGRRTHRVSGVLLVPKPEERRPGPLTLRLTAAAPPSGGAEE